MYIGRKLGTKVNAFVGSPRGLSVNDTRVDYKIKIHFLLFPTVEIIARTRAY